MIFKTSLGREIPIKAVSRLLIDRILLTEDTIKPPTYEVETVTGEKEVHPHSESTEKTEEEKKEWATYLFNKYEADIEKSSRFVYAILNEGVEVTVPDEWYKKAKSYGLEIPDDPIRVKIDYIYTELLGKEEEIGELIATILEINALDKKAVEDLRNSFRTALQGKKLTRPRHRKKK